MNVDAIAKMQEWIDKTKAVEKELSRLEREAKKLSEKAARIRAERQSLKQQIAQHEEAINTLETENTEVKNGILEALVNDNVSEERNLKQRRKQIANEVEEHQTGIRKLSDALDNLENTEQASADIAAKLDMLNFGYAFGFGSQLRAVLVQNELALKSRQGAVKRELPKYSQDVYRGVRAELDEDFAAKQERGGMTEVEYENFLKRRAEQERKNEAAKSPFVGVGAHVGPRRSVPSEQDFSS
jgi:hypothetical protein